MPPHRSVRDLSEELESGQVSSVEIIEQTLAGIESLDGGVGAFLSVADAEPLLGRAAEIDGLRREGRHPSPYAGIPIAVKDNIAVDGAPLTCGSRILENYVSPYNATAVRRLLQAGILVVGKTNMDEFGFGSSTENSAFQVTSNPRDPSRVPGGTSGGSAAAVAAGMVPWALGTDTGGSVRQPASLCGIVGMRPSYGRVSRYGLVAYASSMDQIGPLANDVEDAAQLLSLIAGPDELDSTSIPEPYPGLASESGPLTIGIPDEYHAEGCSAAVAATVDRIAGVAERMGWKVAPLSLPLTSHALAAYYMISSVEASSNLSRYDGVRYGFREASASNWQEMLTATRTEGFGPEAKRRIMLGTFASASGYYDEFYDNARKVRTLLVREFATAFESVDLLLSPVSPTTAWPLGQRLDDPISMYLSDIYSVPAALAGIPATVIPAGNDEDGLPVGVQLAGPALGDGLVARAARQLEAEIGYSAGVGSLAS